MRKMVSSCKLQTQELKEDKKMDLFDKATKVAKNVGDNVISSVKSVSSNIYSSTKEQSELAGLRVQGAVIKKRLSSYYTEIGERYVDYVTKGSAENAFNVDDIMEKVQSELDELTDIQILIAEKEDMIKKNNLEKEKKKAEDEYEAVKSRLDKALELDIISQREYENKLAAAQRKLENYDELRKVKLQYEMDIITREEYDEKVKALTQV